MENLKKKTSAMKSQEEELASLQELRTVVEDLRGENDVLRDNMTKIKAQRDEWMLKLESKVEEQDAYMQKVNELSEENSTLEQKVNDLEKLIEQQKSAKSSEYEEELTSSQNRIQELESSVAENQDIIKSLELKVLASDCKT